MGSHDIFYVHNKLISHLPKPCYLFLLNYNFWGGFYFMVLLSVYGKSLFYCLSGKHYLTILNLGGSFLPAANLDLYYFWTTCSMNMKLYDFSQLLLKIILLKKKPEKKIEKNTKFSVIFEIICCAWFFGNLCHERWFRFSTYKLFNSVKLPFIFQVLHAYSLKGHVFDKCSTELHRQHLQDFGFTANVFSALISVFINFISTSAFCSGFANSVAFFDVGVHSPNNLRRMLLLVKPHTNLSRNASPKNSLTLQFKFNFCNTVM